MKDKPDVEFTKKEKRVIAILHRLNKTCVALPCSSFGVGPPKPGSKDKFTMGLVVRDELTNIDTPVVVTLHKGVRASEAIEALHYVADVIKDAERAAIADRKSKTGRVAGGRSVSFSVSSYLAAIVTTIFGLPGAVLDWLVNRFK